MPSDKCDMEPSSTMEFRKIIIISSVLLLQQTLGLSLPREDADLTVEKANEYIAAHKGEVNQTYRLKYHFSPPIGWTNDPNGFSYYQDWYHLFYQYNPYSVVWNKMHWGHARSKDLVHWEDLSVAMAPDQSYDKDGVYSGSAIEKDGKLYVMYTGTSGSSQVQCIAVSEDGVTFEKIAENPVLDATNLPSNAQPQDFRDPKVFKKDDLYYVVLASKTTDNTGQILLYQSEDLISWEFKSILLEGTKDQGVMFECPDLFELDGKYVLVLSAVQMPASGDDNKNTNTVIEFIGTVDWDEGKFQVETVKETDHGTDFYATQSMVDDEGRRIQIAWMSMGGRNLPTADLGQGWVGAMTLPRELHVKDTRLIQSPISEIYTSGSVTTLTDFTLNDETTEIEGVSGDVAELELTVNLEEAQLFEIDLRVNDKERTVLTYDTSTQKLDLDRSKSGVDIVGSEQPPLRARQVEVPLEDNKLKLQIFLDTSSVEVFANDGVETMTMTIYPTEMPSDKILFKADGKAVIENLSFLKIEL